MARCSRNRSPFISGHNKLYYGNNARTRSLSSVKDKDLSEVFLEMCTDQRAVTVTFNKDESREEILHTYEGHETSQDHQFGFSSC